MPRKPVDPAVRFWRKVDKGQDCWLWTGYLKPNGYASFHPGGGREVEKVYVHRWVYETYRAPIPEGFEIDHLCHVRHCVNPDHLEVVTHRVNLDRRNARKTHCIQGHEFTEANTYWHGPTMTFRRCRTCSRDSDVRRRQQLRAA